MITPNSVPADPSSTPRSTTTGRARMRRWMPAVILLTLLSLPLLVNSCLIPRLGGAFEHAPAELQGNLSPAARDLMVRAFEGLEDVPLLDHHTHVVGNGSSGSGIFLNDEMTSWWHPIKNTKYRVFLSACGIEDVDRADEEYVARLLALVENIPAWGRHCVFAFDKNHNDDGSVNLAHTEFYIPNDYVFALAERHPDIFVPVMSVHPYRDDAVSELTRCAARGGRFIKWLPNAMGIDPASPKCDAYYKTMKQLGLILITHAGTESAVDAADAQKLGNPLRLRRPLDAGVRVVVAHCGSLGMGEDLDSKDDDSAPPDVANFELFLRLMDEPRYQGLVFGEISAIAQVNRVGSDGLPLRTLLARTDLHPRLVNGSDYPVPAVNCVIWTSTLVKNGFITEQERDHLNEIYDYNPLLFDFVVKRTLRHPDTGQKFADSVFGENQGL